MNNNDREKEITNDTTQDRHTDIMNEITNELNK